ncbi:hypothetical protein [Pantanalinema sp. GBBB05]|uniref:hypothetical protein n=1 Tax=Pantanalinema sp. GBBB05 TaxID=2604139 RepID=UPI001D29D116|nr:hypothetical protein [Pantanalinema sp. GBBB05]
MARRSYWMKHKGIVAHVNGANPPTPEGEAAIHAIIEAAAKHPIPPLGWRIEYQYCDRWYLLTACPSEDAARMQFIRLKSDRNDIRLVDPNGGVIDA